MLIKLIRIVALLLLIERAVIGQDEENSKIQFSKYTTQQLNFYREKHNVKPLIYDKRLTKLADSEIKQLISNENFTEYIENKIKKNLGYSFGKFLKSQFANISKIFYETGKNFDFDNYEYNKESTFFIQMLWKKTKACGFAIDADSVNKENIYILGIYYPAADFKDMKNNIFPLNTEKEETNEKKIFEESILETTTEKYQKDSTLENIEKKSDEIAKQKKYIRIPKIDKFNNQSLEKHNFYRKIHNVPMLKLNTKLKEIASKKVKNLVDNFNLDDDEDLKNYGKIASKYSKTSNITGEKMTKNWYLSGKNYDYEKEDTDLIYSKFTQIAWKDTKYCGFGLFYDSKFIYVLGLYFPAGNKKGEYLENVLPPI